MHTIKKYVAYDKRLNPLGEDGNGNRTIMRYYDNENPCGDGTQNGSGEENVYVINSDFSGSLVTVENPLGQRTFYEYTDYQAQK